MRNSTAVIAFFLILAGAMVADSAVVVNRVPNRNNGNRGCVACSYIYSPVCGYSGITHPNSCVARCKNDVRIHDSFPDRIWYDDYKCCILSGHSMPRDVPVSLQRLIQFTTGTDQEECLYHANFRINKQMAKQNRFTFDKASLFRPSQSSTSRPSRPK